MKEKLLKSKGIRQILYLVPFLAICFLLMPMTAFADYADGTYCEHCNEYRYDDWLCDNGDHCAADQGCGEYHHCSDCGGCLDTAYCRICLRCFDCADQCSDYCDDGCLECHRDADGACPDCDKCFANTEEYCHECKYCFGCSVQCNNECEELCLQCHLEEGMACPECGNCYIEGDERHCDYCDMCFACAIEGGLHCPMCGECGNSEVTICPECGSVCSDCADEWCDNCEMCVDCALQEELHCPSCGECGEDVTICPECREVCSECAEFCDDYCGLCVSCATSLGRHCPNCNASDQDVTICPECGDVCSECARWCDYCKMCIACAEGPGYWIPHCKNCESCAEYGGASLCGKCKNVCDVCTERYCGEHGHCFDCAIEADEHCMSCEGCFIELSRCPSCGLCVECCSGHEVVTYLGIQYQIYEPASGNAKVTVLGFDENYYQSHEKINVEIRDYLLNDKGVRIPVTDIAQNAFYEKNKLVSVTMPDSITGDLVHCFSRCDGLEIIVFSNNIDDIDSVFSAIRFSSNIKTIKLPTSVTYLRGNEFMYQKDLQEIYIGKNLKSIETGAFRFNKSLKKVYYEGTEEDWNNLLSSKNCGSDNDILKDPDLIVLYEYTYTGAAAPMITRQPLNVDLEAGSIAAFEILAKGENLEFQWQKSTDGGITWVNSSSKGATTNVLTLTTKLGYNGYKFKCVVTDRIGRTVESNVVTLTVKEKLAITTQPNNVTVTAGETAIFKITATGEELKYQWKKSSDGGKNWLNSSSEGCKTDTLTMVTKANYNGLMFKCEVTDKNGNIIESNAATLTVKEGLAITTQPQNVIVAAGETATFKIAATGDGLQYQWKKSTDGGKNWGNSSSDGCKTDTLTMVTKASYNGLMFKCEVTDKNGKTVTSNPATLTVSAGGMTPLSLTVQPKNTSAASGSSVSFTVKAAGEGLKYQWKKSTDGGKTWVNSSSTGATTSTLTMATKASYNGLQFKCVITDANGKIVESKAAILTVVAAGSLAITTQPTNVTVTAGTTATFKIAATGTGLKYQWKKSTDGGKTWVNSSSTGATTNTLSMATKASYNGLKFKCVVTDANGKSVTSNVVTLTVASEGTLAITTQPTNVTVTAGTTATFKVAATGTGLKYQWKKSTDGGKTWVNSSSTGATTNTLSMATKASFNGLKFKCVVTDATGKTVTSNAAILTVK